MTDTDSIFSFDSEGESYSFSLSLLTAAVSDYFQTTCKLVKLAEGGSHKVYDVVRDDTDKVRAVVRVASAAFPKDKLESEVATIQYLAIHTSVPVPRIYAWNSDASNPAGVEFVIMEKVSGVPADSVLESLSSDALERLVAEVARYQYEMFLLRFEEAGSLYRSAVDSDKFSVGPIVSIPFYRALDGFVRIDNPAVFSALNRFRGAFRTVSDYLSSFVEAELYLISQDPSTVLLELDGSHERLKRGQRVLEKLKELCDVYPGDTSLVYEGTTTPSQRFSLKLDDFRLSNIMIDKESGKIIALIDFEGTTAAPLWDCATVPRWILPSNFEESSGIGLPKDARVAAYKYFMEVTSRLDGSGEWRRAYTKGRAFRLLVDRLPFPIAVWEDKSCALWVDKRLSWAKKNPGVGFPDDTISSVYEINP